MILRYSKCTEDKGILVNSSKLSFDLTYHVDADFPGRFGTEAPLDPVSDRFRTGLILKLGNVPLLWKSQLQSLTSLSTAESEYVALSHAMRVLTL